ANIDPDRELVLLEFLGLLVELPGRRHDDDRALVVDDSRYTLLDLELRQTRELAAESDIAVLGAVEAARDDVEFVVDRPEAAERGLDEDLLHDLDGVGDGLPGLLIFLVGEEAERRIL